MLRRTLGLEIEAIERTCWLEANVRSCQRQAAANMLSHMHKRASRNVCSLLVAIAAVYCVQAVIGIEWGLPSLTEDRFLFPAEYPCPGKNAAEIRCQDRADNKTGSDVDRDPLGDASGQIELNANSPRQAQIYQRFRLYTHQPDEMITMMALSGMAPSEFRFDPKLYQYGGLFIYPVGLLAKLGELAGLYPLYGDLAQYLDKPQNFGSLYVVARVYTAAWGLVGVLVVYCIANRLSGASAGILAAGFFALLPVVVSMSHEAKPHLPGAVLMLLAVLLAMRFQAITKHQTLLGNVCMLWFVSRHGSLKRANISSCAPSPLVCKLTKRPCTMWWYFEMLSNARSLSFLGRS